MRLRSVLGFIGITVVVVVGLALIKLFLVPTCWAADGGSAEAAEVAVPDAASVEHIREAIQAETDPELRQAMEEQLQLLESGQLDLQTLERDRLTLGAPPIVTDGTGATGGGRPGGQLIGPPVEIGTGGQGQGESLPPEVRAQLEQLFQERGTGDPARDAAVRAEAEQILREHGIDPREMGPGHEGEWEREGSYWQGDRGEGFERAHLEQMSPEAREQMERFFSEQEVGEHSEVNRETFQQDFETFQREYEATTNQYEAPTHEYEAPVNEYEAPTHEYEAPEYDSPEENAPRDYDYQPPPQP